MAKIKLPCCDECDCIDDARHYYTTFLNALSKSLGIERYHIKRIYKYNCNKSDCAPHYGYRCIAYWIF